MDISVSVQPFERIYEVIVPKAIFEEVMEHVKREYPIEACGVLLGLISEGRSTVKKIVPLRNVLSSDSAFWFELRDWMKAIIDAKKEGLDYIGIYHSHGRERPLPSLSDRHRMLECPGEVWVIVAYIPGKEPALAAYRVDDDSSGLAMVYLTVTQDY